MPLLCWLHNKSFSCTPDTTGLDFAATAHRCCGAQHVKLSSALQDLMRTAADVTNVVEACNTEGRQERLENMLTQLELCEKALQVSKHAQLLPTLFSWCVSRFSWCSNCFVGCRMQDLALSS